MNVQSKPSKLIKGATGDWEVVIGMEGHAQVIGTGRPAAGVQTADPGSGAARALIGRAQDLRAALGDALAAPELRKAEAQRAYRTLRNEAAHIVEHITFIAVGVVLWWAVVDPIRGEGTTPISPFQKIAALAVAGVPPTVLGLLGRAVASLK